MTRRVMHWTKAAVAAVPVVPDKPLVVVTPRQREARAKNVRRNRREYIDYILRIDAIAVSTYQPLPPPPVDGPDFAAMLDARFSALKEWHKRIMDAGDCARSTAERAAWRVQATVEPRPRRTRADYLAVGRRVRQDSPLAR